MNYQATLFLALLASIEGASIAAPNLPTVAAIKFHRDSIHLEFKWSEKAPPNFDPGTAVEFQVHVDPKCFAEPPGGKDNDISLDSVAHNFPSEARPYKDIWNYWPPDLQTVLTQIDLQCGGLDLGVGKCITLLWPIFKNKIGDGQANFAIGLRDASILNTDYSGKTYHFEYKLAVPMRPECQETDQVDPGDGGASVSMEYFPNKCTLWCPPLDLQTFDCPEVIGFPFEPWCVAGGETLFWIQRLCAPTELYTFIPGQNVGWLGTQCVDRDDDGLFSTQPHAMFGTNVGDCNDDPLTGKSVGAANYDPNTGFCQPSCDDKLQDGGETGVDCGGPCPACDCTPDWKCDSWCDCNNVSTQVCNDLKCGNKQMVVHGVCDHCGNGVCDCGETPVSCAQDCPCGNNGQPCCNGNTCNNNLLCNGGFCGMCTPNCMNKCGGAPDGCNSTCTDPCGNGYICQNQACIVCGLLGLQCCPNNTCKGGVCMNNTCVDPCHDGMKDGQETGVDCGGGVCPACPNGQPCAGNGDCQSGICTNGICTDQCHDVMKDGKETDVDCGGGVCSPCADGKMCFVNADCSSALCVNSICTANGPVALVTGLLDQPTDLAVDATDVYWIEKTSGSLKHVPKIGGNAPTLTNALNNPVALAVDNTYVYIVEHPANPPGAIRRILKGGGAVELVVGGLGDAPDHITQDANTLYFYDDTNNVAMIKQAPKGANVAATTLYSTNAPLGYAIDTDGAFVYFTNSVNPHAWRVPVGGGNATDLGAINGAASFRTINTELYMVGGGNGRIDVMPKAGGAVTNVLGFLVNLPMQLAVDGTYLYWIDAGTINRVNLNGMNRVTYWGEANTRALDIDANFVYWGAMPGNVGKIMRVPK